MRASLRAFAATYGLWVATVAMSPVVARTDTAVPTDVATQGTDRSQSAGNPTPAGTVVAAEDVKRALREIRISWDTFSKCDNRKVCGTYFDSFGVALTFNDGSIAPFTRTQRLTATEHDCIVHARLALDRGDRGLAVQWVMAAKLNKNPAVRGWLGDHPDAVVAALRNCCS